MKHSEVTTDDRTTDDKSCSHWSASGRSKTLVAFHRSVDAGHSFTFWKVTLTLNLANPVGFRPRVSQIEGYGYFPKGKTMTCIESPVECDLCFRPVGQLKFDWSQ